MIVLYRFYQSIILLWLANSSQLVRIRLHDGRIRRISIHGNYSASSIIHKIKSLKLLRKGYDMVLSRNQSCVLTDSTTLADILSPSNAVDLAVRSSETTPPYMSEKSSDTKSVSLLMPIFKRIYEIVEGNQFGLLWGLSSANTTKVLAVSEFRLDAGKRSSLWLDEVSEQCAAADLVTRSLGLSVIGIAVRSSAHALEPRHVYVGSYVGTAFGLKRPIILR
jgi:hypothetical protein